LWRPGTLGAATVEKLQKDISASAAGAGGRVQLVAATGPADFDAAFSAMNKEGAEGLIVLVNPFFAVDRKHIIERAANHRLPAIYEWKLFAQSGGLISYGAVVTDVYRRAGGYVDQIPEGAKPAGLPVVPPIKSELAIHMKH